MRQALLQLCQRTKERFLALFALLVRVPSAWAFLLFMVCETIFLVCAAVGVLPAVWRMKGCEHAQTGVLLCLVFTLVTFNTLVFSYDAFRTISRLGELDDLDEAEKASVNLDVLLAIAFLGLSAFISGGLIVYVFLSLFDVDIFGTSWVWVLRVNEILCVLLYAAFLAADLVCLDAAAIALRHSNVIKDRERARLTRFRKTVKLFVLGCDAPGLVGIVLILFGSTAVHFVAPGFYWHGFVAGGVGMHIVFSQTSLALLVAMDEMS